MADGMNVETDGLNRFSGKVQDDTSQTLEAGYSRASVDLSTGVQFGQNSVSGGVHAAKERYVQSLQASTQNVVEYLAAAKVLAAAAARVATAFEGTDQRSATRTLEVHEALLTAIADGAEDEIDDKARAAMITAERTVEQSLAKPKVPEPYQLQVDGSAERRRRRWPDHLDAAHVGAPGRPITPVIDDVALAAGIRWAVERGAKVVNMSFHLDSGDVVRRAIADAYAADVVLVGAVGNEGKGVNQPIDFPGVLGVGSVDRYGTVVSFSNHGAGVDLVAYGSGMPSALPRNRYETASGTSASSALVAGVAALIRARYPDMSAAGWSTG